MPRAFNLSRNTSASQAESARRDHETPEESEQRLKAQRERQQHQRRNETEEETGERRHAQAVRQYELRSRETPLQHDQRLEVQRERQDLYRQRENPIQRDERLHAQAVRQNELRSRETPLQHEQRLEDQRERQDLNRQHENSIQRDERRQGQAVRQYELRSRETPLQHEQRLQAQQERQNLNRQRENPVQRDERRQAQAYRQHEHRVRENSVQREIRLQHQNQLNEQYRNRRWISMNNIGFNYNPLINYDNHPIVLLGRMNIPCQWCGALRWTDETSSMCCSNGRVRIHTLESPPEPLKSLLQGDSDDSRHFLKYVRAFNSAFQMTSFGADHVEHHADFTPTFTIQGQVYHAIGSLLPQQNDQHSFLQIYFMGNADDELERRHELFNQLRLQLLHDLQIMLHNENNLVRQFISTKDLMINDDYRIIIRADKVPQGQHPRRFNAPTSDEVAILMVGSNFTARDIVLKKRDDTVIRINELHRFYDSLQYPLIFWKGQEGYSINLPYTDPVTNLPMHPTQHRRNTISAMEFYAFHLMVRNDDPNLILHFGNLSHQFFVDMMAKIETERLNYILYNQNKLRCDEYIHLQDAVASDGHIDPANLGQAVILPSSFVNGPRYLAEYTQDAMMYVRKYGKPDLFITMTCNPHWLDITKELFDHQTQCQRHDITARVFRLKVVKLLDVLIKGNFFGPVKAYTYSIEWQKRGLPHIHLLLWLVNKILPDNIDKYVSAEIPDIEEDPILHDIVVNSMLHGPCGPYNQESPCMKDGHCTSHYPRPFASQTTTSNNGYPSLRRRSPEEGGKTFQIRVRGRQPMVMDNRWVVPFNPTLSRMFKTHINVEVCNSVEAIKYICKYINKGADQAIFQTIARRRNINPHNEVQMYRTARYISTNEAIWRILGFPIHQRFPPVFHLTVHLENRQRVYFNDTNLHDIVHHTRDTSLTAFFKLCSRDDFAKTLLYAEVPEYYTWNSTSTSWKRRLRGQPVDGWPNIKKRHVIGRIYTVHVRNFECFCLRLLLNNVRGPTWFNFLKTINNVTSTTFREACELMQLLESDNHWDITMQEASTSRFPRQLRQLFAVIITSCSISNPLQLWDKYKEELCRDFLYHLQRRRGLENANFTNDIFNKGLLNIDAIIFGISGNHLNFYGLPQPQCTISDTSLISRELDYDIHSLQQEVDRLIPLLTNEQSFFFHAVINNINSNSGGLIFLDAPGGTGKTFILNLLLSYVRKNQNIALAVASSGIAATLLAGGRTAHSALKLPLNLSNNDSATCAVTKNSDLGEVLKRCIYLND